MGTMVTYANSLFVVDPSVSKLQTIIFLAHFNSHLTMKSEIAYLALITFQLTCIGIKYGVSNRDPFHQLTLLLLLLIATFSHVLASVADMTKPITVITFHFSGILGCETLMWILIAQLLWFTVVNILLLLLVKLLFFDFLTQLLLLSFNWITQLLPGTPPNIVEMPNTEPQPQEFQV
ncbi:hypothetical protein VNO80_30050 [Phaseolus coccineus]|uniref:Transmembrane protein n=1 Tax=Phaseolus coccineus TaxID=3886 RepID=A0AAN9LC26_PHACN